MTAHPTTEAVGIQLQQKPVAVCRQRVACALLFTPLLAPFYAAILFGRPWALPIGLLLTYPAALLIGVPAVVLLINRRWLSWWHFVATGIVCSIPAVVAYACWGALPQVQAFSAVGGLGVIAWGAFSGLCFWLLGIAGDSPVTLRTILTAGLGDY
jgi:hypothetical protein